jgi:hypothetical protein
MCVCVRECAPLCVCVCVGGVIKLLVGSHTMESPVCIRFQHVGAEQRAMYCGQGRRCVCWFRGLAEGFRG